LPGLAFSAVDGGVGNATRTGVKVLGGDVRSNMSLLPALVVHSSMDPELELDVGELVRLLIGTRMGANAALGAPGSLSGLPVGGI
jgi:hypothetical protein